jgi:Fic family protein
MINARLGDFVGKLRSSKWAKMTKVHRDTARRDIQDLIDKGILFESSGKVTTICFSRILDTACLLIISCKIR